MTVTLTIPKGISMIRTRFAPSPTGDLHIGGVRTALFSWLYAQKHHGEFILRIEDTDTQRSTQQASDVILQGLQWLGLDAQQDIVYQSQRYERYQSVVQHLLKQGWAYRCYCSHERLQQLRQQQIDNGQKPQYDGHCRQFMDQPSESQDHVIRFCNPQQGDVTFTDCVHGTISVNNQQLDDFVMVRTDGTPTYNFCVVVDDSDMAITHVLRGDDHINNTPRQINLYHALDLEPPVFGHVPMILGPDGKRLSKRHGAVNILSYREQGYLPDALLNYLVRLGWSHGDQEIFSKQDMIELFDLEHIAKSPAAINNDKLDWLNQHYIKTQPADSIEPELRWHYQQLNIAIDDGPALDSIIELYRERAKTLKELADNSRFFFESIHYDQAESDKIVQANTAEIVDAVHDKLKELDDWSETTLKNGLKAVVNDMGVKFKNVGLPVRYAVSATLASPAIGPMLAVMGRDLVLQRLRSYREFICQT